MSSGKDNYRERLCNSFKQLGSYSIPGVECEVKLDGNESPFDLNPEIRNEIMDRVSSMKLNRYPDPNARDLKKSVSRCYSISQDCILFGNGSDELIQMLIETFTGKSATVLVPKPTFSMYRFTSLVLGKEVIEVGLDKGFDINLDLTLKHIKQSDPDLFFFSTPNNPTGNSLSKEKIVKILSSTSGLVVIDEAYFDYNDTTFLPLLENFDNLIVLRTMSKIGFASIRLGILFANPSLVVELNKARLPYNINSMTQVISEVAINNYSLLEANFSMIKLQRKLMYEKLAELPNISVFPSCANFFLIKVPNADLYFNKLVDKGILVRNLNGFSGLENCLRVTIGTSSENSRFLDAFSTISFS